MSKTSSTTDLEMAELIMEVVPKIMQVIRQDMRHERGDLTVTQFRVLTNIIKGVGNKELGERLGVSEAAVSRMVDLLVAEQLVEKTVSGNDRRHKVLSLTKSGSELHARIRNSARGRLQEKLSALEEKDREAAIAGLEILQKNLAILG